VYRDEAARLQLSHDLSDFVQRTLAAPAKK
jgi:hypothetical protein